MSGLIESAAAVLSASEKKLEMVSVNVSNAATPGFKRQISFQEIVHSRSNDISQTIHAHPDISPGRLDRTGNPLDLAISGASYFQLRAADALYYSRHGHFRISEDGTVVSPQGHVLQQAGGGDLLLDRVDVEVMDDGTILDGDRPIGRIALFAPSDPSFLQPAGGSLFRAPEGVMEETSESTLLQGMVEASNVSLGDEMVSMMAAMREAETGARLIQTYDDLIGRAITTFGQGGR